MTIVAELKQVLTRHLETASSEEIIEIVSQLAAAEQPVVFSFKSSVAAAGGSRFTKIDGTIWDTTTDLMWSAEDVGPRRHTWEEAKKAAAALTVGGFTDWRLPTIRELLTLVDYERTAPAIDIAAFPSCKSDWYWTSAPLASSPGDYAWYVSFLNGYAGWYSQGSKGLVRAVRPRE